METSETEIHMSENEIKHDEEIPVINNADEKSDAKKKHELHDVDENDGTEANEHNESILTQLTQPNYEGKHGRQSVISSNCVICSSNAVKKRNVLSCHKCNGLIPFHCTKCPPYMLFTLSTSSKKYVCELCAATPDHFLQKIVSDGINKIGNYDSTTQHTYNNPLDKRVSEMCEQFEKYDLSVVADKVQVVYDNLENINNRITENLSLLAKENKVVANRVLVQEKSVDRTGLEETLQNKEAELSSMRASEKLLIESCNEKDKKLEKLLDDKEKNVKTMNEMNTTIQSLEVKLIKYEAHIKKYDEIESKLE